MTKSKKKNKGEVSEIGNKFNILNNKDLVAEVVTNAVAEKKADKRAKFYLYWILGLPLASCARLAGYTKEYGYKLVQTYRNNRQIRAEIEQITNLMPERYKAICRLKLT